MNSTSPRLRLLPALALALPLGIALSGCSVIDEVAHKMRTEHFDTAAELADDWQGDAPWLPSDATDIRIRESTINDTAVILATSGTDLDPAVCTPVSRQSAPAYSMDDAPDVYAADEVYACGVWTVMASDDGWYGWNPGHRDEQAQSPTP
ncbi:MAG: hypothetical protein ABWY23_07340 [Mycetocola sp.]